MNHPIICTSKDFQRVDQKRLNVIPLHFDDRHFMSVNGEDEARIARDGHQAESVAVVTLCAASENVALARTSGHELTAVLSEHSPQQGKRWYHPGSCPCH